jgi:hypothetical protein
MVIDLPTFFAIATPLIGIMAWLFRLESRISVNEALTTELGEDIKYIRNRIDEALL